MPPRLSSQQMFAGGLALVGLGVLAMTFSSQIVFAVIGNDAMALSVASGISGALGQAILTLGVVLVGVSPLARMLERPLKRPDERTVLIRESLDRRARARRRPGS
ncbi:hypothetical protein N1027_07655 [Herbiconiux sp. CPCC 205763]|uniref:Uncharacterized protein n=1 Tax=Herbiconiux aconitum TaxID=2970913 RepID=A0ABT2GPH0_9MICO|nr:hypothetical protein [Herbiconiux aconitum]MCS5718011.1 hypothetical protein [Herbiconiux aconitum]